MAIYLIEIAVVLALALVFDALSLELQGFVWAIIGLVLSIFEAGRIAAVGNIGSSVILSIAFDGSAFQNNTVDGTMFLLLCALVGIASSLIVIHLAWGKTGGA